MLKNQNFWFGVIAGVILCWVYRTYLAKRMGG